MNLIHIVLLAIVQGAAELLPVSSSAHVIVTEKLLGLDPSTPEMTFLLVMLHTGTMFAVLLFFWSRWKVLKLVFLKQVFLATLLTGVVGLGLKKIIEEFVLKRWMGEANGELEMLFKSLPLISGSLFCVGLLILYASFHEPKGVNEAAANKQDSGTVQAPLSSIQSVVIGLVQGLCLPFRGFSRSGATISTGMLLGVSRQMAENFSFALAVILTPPVVARELLRLLKSSGGTHQISDLLMPGLLGMGFSFFSGYLALRWLSSWLESGRWKFFGVYCLLASLGVFVLYLLGF